jgi:hypothetical protein
MRALFLPAGENQTRRTADIRWKVFDRRCTGRFRAKSPIVISWKAGWEERSRFPIVESVESIGFQNVKTECP